MFKWFFRKKNIVYCDACLEDFEISKQNKKEAKISVTFTNKNKMNLCGYLFSEVMKVIKKEPKRLESMEEFTVI